MLIRSTSIPASSAVTPDTAQALENTDNLVQKCVSGEESAWRTLVDRYAALVYSIPRHYHLDDHEAQDVSQIVWEKVILGIRTLQSDDNLRAWIVQIAYNTTKDYLRARKETVEIADEMPALDVAITQVEQADDLYRAILRLNAKEQMFIHTLLVHPGATYDELADLTGIKRAHIGMLKQRTLEKLGKLLSK